jgi:hypothetical protein
MIMHRPTFGEMFVNTWTVFKGNYGLCLSYTLLIGLLSLVASISVLIAGLMTSDVENIWPMVWAVSAATWFVNYVMIAPIFFLLAFSIVQRVRGESGRKSGSYLRVLLISACVGFFLMPSTVLNTLGNPGAYEELKLLPEYLKVLGEGMNQQAIAAANTKDESDDGATDEASEKLDALKAQTVELQAMSKPTYTAISGLYGFIFLLFLIRWKPWAMMIACDPQHPDTGAMESAQSGWRLGTGVYGGSIGTLFVITLIAIVSFMACFLPAIFFGFPLAFAWLPGVYLLLVIEKSEAPPIAE